MKLVAVSWVFRHTSDILITGIELSVRMSSLSTNVVTNVDVKRGELKTYTCIYIHERQECKRARSMPEHTYARSYKRVLIPYHKRCNMHSTLVSTI